MFARFCFVIIILCALTTSCQSLMECTNAIKSESFDGLCSNQWKQIKPFVKPTQPEVGYAWILYKLEKSFAHEVQAQISIEKVDAIPAVLGPNAAIYIVDDHHTLSALDYSGFDQTIVTFTILCDQRNMSEEDFWRYMEGNHFAYLAAHPEQQPDLLPEPISYKQLASHFSHTKRASVFGDDPWRSLAAFSRKVTSPACDETAGDSKYCLRCMFRGCGVNGLNETGPGVYYFEFRWSYFFNELGLHTSDVGAIERFWGSWHNYGRFRNGWKDLAGTQQAAFNASRWLSVAETVFPLCRSVAAGDYQLPKSIFFVAGDTSLPGHVAGESVKLPDDPTCNAASCH